MAQQRPTTLPACRRLDGPTVFLAGCFFITGSTSWQFIEHFQNRFDKMNRIYGRKKIINLVYPVNPVEKNFGLLHAASWKNIFLKIIYAKNRCH